MSPKELAHIDDKSLLEKYYQSQDNTYLGALLQKYTYMLLGVGMKYLRNEEEAKDCVQQVFEKVLKEADKYKVEYFKSWLYMIAKNHCLMQLRKRKNYFAELQPNTEAYAAESDTALLQAAIEKDATLHIMELALKTLTKEQQDCITLFYLQKKSYDEITLTTGLDYKQVKSHIQNGKRNLKLKIERHINDE